MTENVCVCSRKVKIFLIRKLWAKDTEGRHEGHIPLMKSSYVEARV